MVTSLPALVCFVLECVRMGPGMDAHICGGTRWKYQEYGRQPGYAWKRAPMGADVSWSGGEMKEGRGRSYT